LSIVRVDTCWLALRTEMGAALGDDHPLNGLSAMGTGLTGAAEDLV
jgi:hypothetical protein